MGPSGTLWLDPDQPADLGTHRSQTPLAQTRFEPAEKVCALLVSRPGEVPAVAEPLIAVPIGVVITSTALRQAPAHKRLARRFDPGVHRMLVRTNWLRTLCWTVIAVLDLWLVSR